MDTTQNRRGGRSLVPFLVVAWLLAGTAPALAGGLLSPPNPEAAESADFSAGMPLTEALLRLQERGLRLVFSSQVVRADMRVLAVPRSRVPRAILEEVLAPHALAVEEGQGGSLVVVATGRRAGALLRGSVRSRGALAGLPGVSVTVVERGVEAITDGEGRFEFRGLDPGVYTLRARRPGFVIDEREAVRVSAGPPLDLDIVLQPAPLTREEVVVHPSRITVLQEEPVAPFAWDRDDISRLPHLGGDVFRTISLLPGTTANDLTAQFHVRGGRRDEVIVLLDGQELYEAYHLKDFDNALSVVPASGLSNLDLTTGAFPSDHGDRMGAILDLTTLTPARPRRLSISVSILNAQLEGSGLVGERLGWLASVRRGATDLAGDIFNEEDPSFWDVFGKLDYRLGSRQSARVNVLHAEDEFDFLEEQRGEVTRFNTEYDSSYLWLTHQAVLSERLFVDTAGSISRIGRDRRGAEHEDEKRLDVRDERELEVTGLLQSWNFQAAPRHYVKAGFEVRRFQATYDYESFRDFRSPLAAIRSGPGNGTFDFRGRFTDDYLAAYVTDRFAPLDSLALELGVRYDRHSLTDGTLWSPRASLAWGLGSSSVLRLGWGHYFQNQRVYELMPEDGDTRLYPAERAEHWVIGFERRFDATSAFPVAAVRTELYQRRVKEPKPRYENLLEPFEHFSEGSLSRVRLEPDDATARGVEVFVHGRTVRRLGWWLNYAYSKTEDEIDDRDVPRQIDQRHAVNLDLNYNLGRRWDVNLAWRYHTGWRITSISLEAEDGGEPRPVLGPLNSDRLPDYHRLDARISRKWDFAPGTLTFFVDVQNLYHRYNVAGLDVEIDAESGEIVTKEERWPGFFASIGVSWIF